MTEQANANEGFQASDYEAITDAGRVVKFGGWCAIGWGISSVFGAIAPYQHGEILLSFKAITAGLLAIVTGYFLRAGGQALKAAGKSGPGNLAKMSEGFREMSRALRFWFYSMIGSAVVYGLFALYAVTLGAHHG